MKNDRRTTPEMFWQKIRDKPGNGCWFWSQRLDSHGYGLVKYHGNLWKAHRVAYFLASGKNPLGLEVCHSCDNPACCNPDHLWLGTHAENMADSGRKGRAKKPEKGVPGSLHYKAILDEDKVRQIWVWLSDGVSQAEIARRYGVCFWTINKIKLGKTWLHVKPNW